MLEKKKRVVDSKGMKEVKVIDYSERCGRESNDFYCLEVAYVKGKGCKGPDIRENCLKLCGPVSMGMGCHGADHRGGLTDDELFANSKVRE
jgi:hypothetical protein